MTEHFSFPAAGVICEFNPFHNGHAYLLSQARELVGEDGCVICVMSGRSTQRGEVAMADPYLRGHMALCGGADLVVELPFPWSSGSAEAFGKAGVRILEEMGVEHLLFGSECGDINLLCLGADLTRSESFGDLYARLCTEGMGTAAAYGETLRLLSEQSGLSLPQGFPSSNDLLGISYLSAMSRGKAQAHTVKRRGQAYNDPLLTDTDYPSATALRVLIKEAACDPYSLSAMLTGTMPEGVLTLLTEAIEKQEAPTDGSRLLPLYHAYFRLEEGRGTETAELSGGLRGHLRRAAFRSTTVEDFMEAARTKQYTDARLRRAMLFALTGVTHDNLTAPPAYTTLLAANQKGCTYLSHLKKRNADGHFTVVTKPSDAPVGRQSALTEKMDALFTLCLPKPQPAGALMKRSPLIEK